MTGFIEELPVLVLTAGAFGSVGGGISVLCGWTFAEGLDIGILSGMLVYAMYCVLRLYDDSYSITIFKVQKRKTIATGRRQGNDSGFSAFNGVMGIVTVIAYGLYYVMNYLDMDM